MATFSHPPCQRMRTSLLLVVCLLVCAAAAQAIERYFFEAESMTVTGDWPVATHSTSYWYTGLPSRNQFLDGYRAAAGSAVRSLMVHASGNYTLWVRYSDQRVYRGRFTVTVRQNGATVGAKTFDQESLRLTPEGEAKWGNHYTEWVWDALEIPLAAGPVEVELTKYGGAVSWVTRYVDCFALTDDLCYEPKVNDFAGDLLPERHFFEAEGMRVTGDWPIATHSTSYWYYGLPSRNKFLDGYRTGAGMATKTLTLQQSGNFKLWVRYSDQRVYRGRFTVTVKQNGATVGSKTFDQESLRLTPEGEAKWGAHYTEWVWDALEIPLAAGPVEVELTKYGGAVSWVTRYVDCFALSADPAYEPQVADFAALPLERRFFEAEWMQVSGNWPTVAHDAGLGYSGTSSRNQFLDGHADDGATGSTATKSTMIDESGTYNLWVRYTDKLDERGPFTVTVKQDGVVVGTKTFDLASLHPGTAGAEWVWDCLQVSLAQAPVVVEVSRGAGAVSAPVRLLDCFVLAGDLNYAPQVADYAVDPTPECHFFEAESMLNDGANWRGLSHFTGWYTGGPSRARMLRGSEGGQGEATRAFTVAASGHYKVWVRYLDVKLYRGPFTVTVMQNGAAVGAKTFDLASLRLTSEGQAKWGNDYANWVWDALDVQLAAGEAQVVLSKATPLTVSWITRHVDCFAVTADLNTEPTVGAFATPLYVRIRMGAAHPQACVIHLFGRRQYESYIYIPHTNFYTDRVVTPQNYTGYNPNGPNTGFLTANTETPWYNLAPFLGQVGRNALTFTAIQNWGVDLASANYTVQLSTTPSDAGIFKQFTRSGSGCASVVNIDLTQLYLTRSDLEYSQSDLAATATLTVERPTTFPVFTGNATQSNYHQPTTVSNNETTLKKLGINGTNHYDAYYYQRGMNKILAAIYSWNYWHNGCMSDINTAGLQAKLQSAAQPYITAGVAHNVLAWNLMDEPGSTTLTHISGDPAANPPTAACPTCTAKFRTYLQGLGLQPSFFGKTSWTEVVPVNDPADAKAYYYTVKFQSQILADYFQTATNLLQQYVPNARTTANFAEEPTFNGNALTRGVDRFLIYGQGALTFGWSEDWLSYSTSYQLCGYIAEFLRAARPDQQFGMYEILRTPWDSLAKTAAEIGHGARANYHYNFGPEWLGSADGKSGNYALYPALNKLNAGISRVEGHLVGATVPDSPIGLLYAHTTDVWTLKDADGYSEYGKERMGLYLLLRHLGYPVEFVTEEDAEEGRLGHYQAIFVVGSHLRSAAAQALLQWTQAGGRLYYNAGSLSYNEFNQPLNLDAALGIARQAYVFKQHAGREYYELPNTANNDPFSYQGTALEGIIGVQKFSGTVPPDATVLATFNADGSPALITRPCGAGRVVFCGAFPGLAYQKSGVISKKAADLANPSRGTYNPPDYVTAYQSLLGATLNGLAYTRPVTTNHYLVEANVLASGSDRLVTLSNWTGTPQSDVVITLPSNTIATPPYAALGAISAWSVQNGVLSITLSQLDEADFLVIPSN